jgi:hypothetical protein
MKSKLIIISASAVLVVAQVTASAAEPRNYKDIYSGQLGEWTFKTYCLSKNNVPFLSDCVTYAENNKIKLTIIPKHTPAPNGFRKIGNNLFAIYTSVGTGLEYVAFFSPGKPVKDYYPVIGMDGKRRIVATASGSAVHFYNILKGTLVISVTLPNGRHDTLLDFPKVTFKDDIAHVTYTDKNSKTQTMNVRITKQRS